jgi:hypothetical protein
MHIVPTFTNVYFMAGTGLTELDDPLSIGAFVSHLLSSL